MLGHCQLMDCTGDYRDQYWDFVMSCSKWMRPMGLCHGLLQADALAMDFRGAMGVLK